MRKSGLAATILSLLLAFQPAFATPPPSPVATVSGRGPIRVNGMLVPPGTSVYAGSRIDTGPGAVAFVVLPHGSKLVLGASTSARLVAGKKDFPVKLEKGTLGAVSEAGAPVLVETRGVTIRTKNAEGTYEVAVKKNSVEVLARSGAAVAEEANRTVDIPEGKMMKATLASSRAGTSKGHLETVLVVAGAGAAAGLAAAIRTLSGSHSQNCASPSQLGCP